MITYYGWGTDLSFGCSSPVELSDQAVMKDDSRLGHHGRCFQIPAELQVRHYRSPTLPFWIVLGHHSVAMSMDCIPFVSPTYSLTI